MKRHEEILEEFKLRRLVRKAIRIRETKNKQSLVNEKRDEKKLRAIVRTLLKEGDVDSDTKPAPYESTPINMLADAFNQILPVIKTGLRKLSRPEERQSYRLHILEKLKSLFDTFESLELKKTGLEAGAIGESDLTEAEEDESLSMKVRMLSDEGRIMPSDASEDTRFAEEEPDDATKLEQDFDKFRMSDLNPTGARVAFETLNDSNIESVLADKRRTLFDVEDKDEFKDYTLYNADLWLLTYEEELSRELGQSASFNKPIMARPETAQEIGAGAEFAPGAGEVAAAAGGIGTTDQEGGEGELPVPEMPEAEEEGAEENTEFTF